MKNEERKYCDGCKIVDYKSATDDPCEYCFVKEQNKNKENADGKNKQR